MRKWFGQPVNIPAGYPTTATNYAGLNVNAVNWQGAFDASLNIPRADTLQQNPSDSAGVFQFDDQSDNIPQKLSFPAEPVHSILQGSNGPIARFPYHMHEGEAVTPASLQQAQQVSTGRKCKART